MKLINITSYGELQVQLKETPNAYLLLYKSGSDASDCALANASRTVNENVVFMAVDATKVRDIHGEYGVTSAPILLSFKNGEMSNSYKGCNDVSFYDKIFAQDFYVVQAEGEERVQKRVTVYSSPSCSWCGTLKKHLDVHGIRYQEINIASNHDAAEEMVKKSGKQGVPQTDINGQMVVGFDKVKLNSLLGIK